MVRWAVTCYLFFQFLLSTGHSRTVWLTLLLGDSADPLIISWSIFAIVAIVIAYMQGILPKVLDELRIIPKMSNLVNLCLICLVVLLW